MFADALGQDAPIYLTAYFNAAVIAALLVGGAALLRRKRRNRT